MPIPVRSLSRAVSHALRHAPWVYELELDDEGWADVDQLLRALRDQGGEWADLDRADIERMVRTADKKRHELRGGRIRALYGHSVPCRIRREPAVPPVTLFHGTAPSSADRILVEGLRPMGRKFVHLSTDQRTALEVGRRKHVSPVILRVAALEAARSGVMFYRGNNRVWLARPIPPTFIERMDDRRV